MFSNPNGVASFPQIAFIPFQAVAPQKRPNLILKTDLPVMFFLIGNVSPNLVEIRLADRECCIANCHSNSDKTYFSFSHRFETLLSSFTHSAWVMVRPNLASWCT